MKKRRRYTAKRRTPTRRWHIPPPLIHGPEALEGGGILQEWGDELGVILWQASRDVLLWATAEPKHRAEVFASGGGASGPSELEPLLQRASDARLRSGLRCLQQLVVDPEAAREESVARACRQLSEWAHEKGKFATALAFAQDAALTARTSAAAAFWVANVAARINDHARAETWFRRAVGLARQSRDWRMYSRAFRGLGNLYSRRGNLPAARRLHTRALRGARRGGMRQEQAASLHDLFAVAVDGGNVIEAERLARQALEAFGTRNPRIHVLAHDVAYFWMEQGHFARARAVFQAVLPHIDHRVERLLVLSNLVRAAGGIGDRETADAATTRIERMIRQPDLRIGAARALLEVARGYISLGDNQRAEAAARGSLDSALEHREAKVQFAAEGLLLSLRERPDPVVHPASPQPLTPSAGDDLAAEFVRTLHANAGAAS